MRDRQGGSTFETVHTDEASRKSLNDAFHINHKVVREATYISDPYVSRRKIHLSTENSSSPSGDLTDDGT